MLDFVQSLILKVEGKFSTYVDNFFELISPILYKITHFII